MGVSKIEEISRDSWSGCPHSAAEDSNAEGNRLYREGNVIQAAAAYTSAIAQSLMAPSVHRDTNPDLSILKRSRSKYYANRAQARVQLKDFQEAAQDCCASVGENPENAKALVRWGLCKEALGYWDEALQHFEKAATLLLPGSTLFRTALEGGRRARMNGNADRKVAHEDPMPKELVHQGQMLRLSFRDALPVECRPGDWFSVTVGLSNEFGLWRRSDFGQPKQTPSSTKNKIGSKQSATPCSSTYSEGFSEAPEKAAGLTLVFEARNLEEFGGRSQAGHRWPHQRHGGRLGQSTSSVNTATSTVAPVKLVRGLEEARGYHQPREQNNTLPSSPSNITPSATTAETPAVEEYHRIWTIETDGDHAMGCEGKTTLRMRFVGADCWGGVKSTSIGASNCINHVKDAALPSNVNSVVPESSPLLMLVRVSVVEEEAASFLGRGVVPVLSLPIAVFEAKPHLPEITERPSVEGKPWGSFRLAEQRALAASAFNAGAVTCREACIPVTVATSRDFAVDTTQMDRWRRSDECCHRGSDQAAAGREDSLEKCCKRNYPDANQLDGSDDHSFENESSGNAGSGSSCACLGSKGGNLSLEERIVLVAESPGQLGIGGKVWDSAFVLCDYLAKTQASASFPPPVLPNACDGAAATKRKTMPIPANNGDAVNGTMSSGTCLKKKDEAKECLRAEPISTSRDESAQGSVEFPSHLQEDKRHNSGQADQHTMETTSSNTSPGWGLAVRGLVHGKRVLELGAGTGLVSVCCALLGASAVVATDFEDVTELIRVNVALNFSGGGSSSPSSPLSSSLSPPFFPSSSNSPSAVKLAAAQLSETPSKQVAQPSATASPGLLRQHAGTTQDTIAKTTLPTAVTEATAMPVGRKGSELPVGAIGDDLVKPLPWHEQLSTIPVSHRQLVPVTTVPLVWGEHSDEVERFAPEVVVMSDVVYDPAGYQPLLETLLDVLQPGMIAIMAHRHRHPEDHSFFSRLKQLFHVLEEERAKSLPRTGRTEACFSSSSTGPAVPKSPKIAEAAVATANLPTTPSSFVIDGGGAAKVGASSFGGDTTEEAHYCSQTINGTLSRVCEKKSTPLVSLKESVGELTADTFDSAARKERKGDGTFISARNAMGCETKGNEGEIKISDGGDVRIFRIWSRSS